MQRVQIDDDYGWRVRDALAVVSARRLATHRHRDCEVVHQVRAKRGPMAGSVVARRRSRNDGLR
jgi:hypothetical protein